VPGLAAMVQTASPGRIAAAAKSGPTLAAAYVLTGQLALALALPPGYASAIFPPAGIAVAAAFISGRRAWAWIFLGSFLLNLWVGYSPQHPISLTGQIAAGTIALASVLQAAVGGWSLRRLIGYPTAFDRTGEVLKFLLLAPVVCLVSASLSVSGLTALGTLDGAGFAANWFTWWIGDTLGVIVLVPLVLVIAGEPRPLWRSRAPTVAAPMMAAFALVVFVFVQAARWEYKESLGEFKLQSQSLADLIQTRFEEQEFVLRQIGGFLSNDPARPVSRDEFHRFVDAFRAQLPMVQAIEWAPRIASAQRRQFESALGADFPGFQIREPDPAGGTRSAADRPEYFPVTYLEPVETNRAVIGLDLASTPDRRSTVSRTMNEGVPVASTTLRLVQQRAPQAGILLMLRARAGANGPGVAVTVLKVGDFIEGALPVDRSAFHIRLSDAGSEQTLYDTLQGADASASFERTLTFGTRLYQLHTEPSSFYLTHHRGWKSWTFLAAGLFGCGVLGALLLLGTGSIRRREAEERLALSLAGSDLAMTDWDIARDRLVLGAGWESLLGYRPGELGSVGAALGALIHPDDVAAARDTLIRHLKGQTPLLEREVRMRHRDGHWVWVLARGTAVERSPAGRALRVTGTAKDITARKKAEADVARLSQLNELLLNSAGEGIYGLDRHGQCSFINPAALAILGFSRDEMLGKNVHHLFHHHRQDGSACPEEDCPALLTLVDGIRRQAEDAFVRKSGEVFPVQMTVTPMLDNGQLVGAEVVFQDISGRKATEAELVRLATTDPLTGVANRRSLLEQLDMAVARVRRFAEPASLLLVDIDRFKSINDTHGHAAGDAVLKHFANVLRSSLRRVDCFGRLGGEEFGIVLPRTESAVACQFADRLRRILADTPGDTDKGLVGFTVSIGVAQIERTDTTPDAVLARADAAMYRAKDNGRNRVELSV
jgi:diguanylate cyclase (GGDEF)-like protein/PAS domain S-box-containing protein